MTYLSVNCKNCKSTNTKTVSFLQENIPIKLLFWCSTCSSLVGVNYFFIDSSTPKLKNYFNPNSLLHKTVPLNKRNKGRKKKSVKEEEESFGSDLLDEDLSELVD